MHLTLTLRTMHLILTLSDYASNSDLKRLCALSLTLSHDIPLHGQVTIEPTVALKGQYRTIVALSLP